MSENTTQTGAVDRDHFRDAFSVLADELNMTESVFSRDSKEYLAARKELAQLLSNTKGSTGTGAMFDLKNLKNTCEEYCTAHKFDPRLTNRQKSRMEVMRRIISLCDRSEAGMTDPYSPENLKRSIAEKTAGAILSVSVNDNNSMDLSKKMLSDNTYQENYDKLAERIAKDPAFKEMVDHLDEAGLKKLVKEPGMKLARQYKNAAQDRKRSQERAAVRKEPQRSRVNQTGAREIGGHMELSKE